MFQIKITAVSLVSKTGNAKLAMQQCVQSCL